MQVYPLLPTSNWFHPVKEFIFFSSNKLKADLGLEENVTLLWDLVYDAVTMSFLQSFFCLPASKKARMVLHKHGEDSIRHVGWAVRLHKPRKGISKVLHGIKELYFRCFSTTRCFWPVATQTVQSPTVARQILKRLDGTQPPNHLSCNHWQILPPEKEVCPFVVWVQTGAPCLLCLWWR